ncbi:restriction endonuclease subunit S [Staphylococcus hominis]|uniref:restriction endonuclease subunit S n=1 Tax=Staphylococcus hominis TaxID=1290 RepID=UPI0023028862|nr:restriction endonuclease subunit S [Staphylococcus hominis]
MSEQINTPKLRFPEFRDEWESKEFKDIIKINSGKDYKHLNIGKYPVYGTGGYMLSVSDYLYKNDAIGIGRKGTINKPYLLKGPFWTVDTLFYCTPLANNDLSFLLNLFRKVNWKKYDESTGVPSLSKVTISKIKCKVPIISEQEKIGTFFSKLDHQIELEEEKLELLEQQKKGYMQKIFSQQLKFKDENGQYYTIWKAEKLGKLTDITTGSLDANAMVPNGKYKFFTCARETYEIDTYAFDTEALLISGNGANVGYIHYYQGKFNAYQRTYVLNNFKTNITYLKYYLEKYLLKRIYSEKRDGNTPYITRSTLYDMEILIPSLEEQEKIGNFFNKIDNLIELQTDKIEVLKQRKKGLLQKMFV